jgi:hypothetical protein
MWLVPAHHGPTSLASATPLDLTRTFPAEVTRSHSRFHLAVEDQVEPPTTTTVAPTTTTTVAPTTTTTVRPTTTTVRIRPITTTTTEAIEAPAETSTSDRPEIPQSCYGHKMARDAAYGCWEPLLAQYTWSVSKAFSVLYCESTGSSTAQNGIYHGLMQIENGPYDPYENIALAWDYYSRRGWQPWSCA